MIETPYKGLSSFADTAIDALLFFGRERETETIVSNVLANRLTVVYGPSGVGKSSVIRAGVVQRLRAVETGVVVVHDAWAEHPVDSLVDSVREACPDLGPAAGLADTVAAAAHASGEVYLVLDQFEEYFLYHGGEGPLADELPDLLRRPGVRVNTLIALRDDAVSQLDAFTGRVPEMFGNLLRLERLDRGQGRDAIVGPLARYGELTGGRYGAESELVEAVLDQVAEGRVDFSGAGDVARERSRIETPFLQLVLERLWETERAQGSTVLRLRTFEALGGAQAIVREHVFGSLDRLPADARGAAARVVRQLVTPSGTKISYTEADLAEYADVQPDELRGTLETLLQERIVRGVNGSGATATRYEIFHDVLAEPVLAWRQGQEVERERERARRQRRRLLTVVGAAIAAILVLAAITTYAFTERGHARQQARHAQGGQLVAQSLAAAADNPARSVSLALRAARLVPASEAEPVLRAALLALRERRVVPLGGNVVAATFSPRDGTLLSVSSNGRMRVGDVRRREQQATAAAWRGDGERFAIGSANGTVNVWTPDGRRVDVIRTRSPIHVLRYVGNTLLAASGGYVLVDRRRIHVRGAVLAADLTRDGSTLAVATRRRGGNVAQLLDLRSPRARVRATLPERGIESLALSPDGALLATGSGDRTARLWRVPTGKLVLVMRHRGHVVDESFSRSGRLLVTASTDGDGQVWDVHTHEHLFSLTGATGAALDAEFAPDASEIAVAFGDGFARVYDGRDGRILATLGGHEDAVTSVEFDRRGHLIATASADGTSRVWDANAEDQLAPIAHFAGTAYAAFDGGRVTAAGSRRAEVIRVDGAPVGSTATAAPVASMGRTGETIDARGNVYLPWGSRWSHTPAHARSAARDARFIVIGTDGGALQLGGRTLHLGSPVVAVRVASRRVLAATRDGRIRVLTRSGARVSSFSAPAQAVALSPDGTTVATAHARDAELRSAENGVVLARLRGHTSLVDDIEFSPDGKRVVTASVDHTARVWDAHTGRLLHVLRGHFFAVRTASFSPDSRWIVTSSQFTAGLWDASTGKRIFYLRGHTKPLTGAQFGPGNWIVTASRDGTARVLHCDICRTLPGLEQVARARLAALAQSS